MAIGRGRDGTGSEEEITPQGPGEGTAERVAPIQNRIPRGIDVLIMKASVDPEFRKVLLEKRSDAASLIDLELSPAEASMFEAVPRDQLERIIEHTTVPEEHRRVFLGKMGCLMLALLGAAADLWLFYGGRRDRVRSDHLRIGCRSSRSSAWEPAKGNRRLPRRRSRCI
ncbi:MAG: hypothetical protein AB1646_02530 [Thermodesulfobacteriota bacterium]